MNNIALNFVALKNQHINATIYRRKVVDSTQPNDAETYRVRLLDQSEGDTWALFDVSVTERNGYEPHEYDFSTNVILTNHLIYQQLKSILEDCNENFKHYFPQKAIASRSVHFTTDEVKEGTTEFIVKPYCLRAKKIIGFTIEHRFRLNAGQEFNRDTQILSFSLDRSGKPNIYFYKDKRHAIETFIRNTFFSLLQGTDLEVVPQLSTVKAENLNVKTYIVGDGNASASQFMGIKKHGPYRRMEDEVRYLFIFTERTRSLARDIYLGLVGKLFPGQFSGLELMFNLPISKDMVGHYPVETYNRNSIRAIEAKIGELKSSHPEAKILLIPVLPRGFKGVDAAFDAYGHLKLIALRNDVYCQVVTEDTFFKKDQLKWSVSNIGLQIFSKLGGAPWLVKPAKSNCLIFGIGSAHEKEGDHIVRYSAYTVCLDTSGDFKYIKPLSSSKDESKYLESLKSSLTHVLSDDLDTQYQSLVLHLPYKISKKEIETIKKVAEGVRADRKLEVIVIRVNAKHKFLGFSEHNTCVPYESSYVQLSNNEFLIWAEGLQYGKEILHKRVSEPLYVEFIEGRDEWETKKLCLQDILNLTGANWRGFNSKAQPISILYSTLIAKFMKEFAHIPNTNDFGTISAESQAPWFL